MPRAYTEDQLVEQPAIGLFAELGWQVVSALEDPNPEVAGQGYARLRARGIVVETGLAADEARRTLPGETEAGVGRRIAWIRWAPARE